MTTSAQQVKDLNSRLNEMLAKRAVLDEQITSIRATLHGVNLGAALEREEATRRAPQETPED